MDKIIQAIKSKDKNDWLVVAVVVITFFIALFFVSQGGSKEEIVIQPKEDAKFASSVQHSDLKTYFTNQINKKIKQQNTEVSSVKSSLEQTLSAREKQVSEILAYNKKLEERIDELSKKVSERGTVSQKTEDSSFVKISSSEFEQPAFDANIIPAHINNGQNRVDSISRVSGFDEIELVSVNLSSNKPKFKNIATYVPAGTFIEGVVIGGVEAGTEVNGANNQTRVVTIRFIDNGNIPGGYKASLKDCTLLASAFGIASSERVALRGERLTCVAGNGNVLETNIIASIYGSDGRQDVRGRMVYPESKLLTRAFIAGSLSGIGNGVANSFSAQSISPLGATSIIPNEDIFKYGAAQGVGKGLDKLADYYIKRAEQLQPVVQLGSGAHVTAVIQKGFYLDGKEHSEASTQAPESPFEKTNHKEVNKYNAEYVLANTKGTF